MGSKKRDRSSGVAIFDSYSQGTAKPWVKIGGTSLSSPAWAAIIAIANQVRAVAGALNPTVPSVVSVFAGRIADAGVDPMPIMRKARELLAQQPKAELLWASVR